MKTAFKQWLLLAPWKNVNCHCPICNEQNIEYLVVGGDITPNMGTGMIWCKSCKKGIHISRMAIPESAKSYTFEETENNKKIFPSYEVNWVQP